ncbi:MAG: bromoperoxidase [Pseudomonadota bacterium]
MPQAHKKADTPVFSDAERKARAKDVAARRDAACNLSLGGGQDVQLQNGDEIFPYIFNFTKGVEHSIQGLPIRAGNPNDDVRDSGGGDYGDFVRGSRSADPREFDKAPLFNAGNGAREWESPTGGFAFALQGPDAQSIAIPPAPVVGSNELSAEMAEVYQMALLRDFPVAAFMKKEHVEALNDPFASLAFPDVEKAADTLSDCKWFKRETNSYDINDKDLSAERRRLGDKQMVETLFRGIGEGTREGPLVSQFMVMGTGDTLTSRDSLNVRYGNQRIRQDTRVAVPGCDYMQTWDKWLEVQNAVNTRDQNLQNEFVPGADGPHHRPILTLRDIATYVHDDALYQAYLNAALLLLSERFASDRGIPYNGSNLPNANPNVGANRSPFSVFGPPHLLTLVTEVSALALRAVRFQKFTAHRRARPEHIAARYHTICSEFDPSGRGPFNAKDLAEGAAMKLLTDRVKPTFSDSGLNATLKEISSFNKGPWLLPMAFPEGSPMHPSYGAGHATVAGACVTVLKAFFEMGDPTDRVQLTGADQGREALVIVGTNKDDLQPTCKKLGIELSLVGELNKLAWNIANGRNMAGVHYFTDSIESLLLGETVAIGMLREQMLTYDDREEVTMRVPLFVKRTLPSALLTPGDGVKPGDKVEEIVIMSDGSIHPA